MFKKVEEITIHLLSKYVDPFYSLVFSKISGVGWTEAHDHWRYYLKLISAHFLIKRSTFNLKTQLLFGFVLNWNLYTEE